MYIVFTKWQLSRDLKWISCFVSYVESIQILDKVIWLVGIHLGLLNINFILLLQLPTFMLFEKYLDMFIICVCF